MFRVTIAIGLILFVWGGYLWSSASEKASEISPNTGGEQHTNQKQRSVGFLPSWVVAEKPDINLSHLTTLLYFGFTAQSDGTLNTSNAAATSFYKNGYLEQLKEDAKKEGVQWGVSIYNHNASDIEELLRCDTCQTTLARDITTLVTQEDIESINLDIEYPSIASQELRNGYSALARKVRAALPQNVELSVAIPPTSGRRARLSSIAPLAETSDYLILMAYDFHKLEGDVVGPVAPLYGAPERYPLDVATSVEDTLRRTTPDKVVLGIPLYGHAWITQSAEFGSARIPGNDEIGFSKVVYLPSCAESDNNTKDTYRWDEISQTPWFTYFDQSIGHYKQCYYENERSLAAKLNFVKEKNLAGTAFWALGFGSEIPFDK